MPDRQANQDREVNLEEFLEQASDKREYKRGQAVKLDLAGYARKATAVALSVSVNFVSKWRLQYNRHGAPGLALSYQGSKGYLSAKDKEQVLEWLAHQSPHIGRETLESYLESEYGVRYKSTSSYYELLYQAGLSYKKRQGVNPKKDAQKVLDKRQEIKKR
jgi:putative transposase